MKFKQGCFGYSGFSYRCFRFFVFSLLSLSIFSGNTQAATWDLNDVSYLFPLPTSRTDGEYLKARDFLPSKWMTEDLADSDGYPFSIDSTLLNTSTKEQFKKTAAASFDSIRLLAVRIDPCFQDLYSDPCRLQIRGVWQPVDKKGSAVDAAVHTFYDLDQSEFTAFATQLLELKSKYHVTTTNLPLQVHPGFKKNGFAKDLFTLLKAAFRPERLTRVAFMKLLAPEFQWRLQSFDVKNGVLKPIEVPLHGGFQQTFAIHRGGIPAGTLHLDAGDLARSRNGDGLDSILLDYSLRIENPKLNIPGVTDCLSCHASGGVKGWAAASLNLNPIPTVADVVGLKGKYNLQNVTGNLQDRIHFRALGYVFREPSLNDRVIIETALVADAMTAR